MNWIEGIFHLSPDNGTGATEMILAGCVALILGTVFLFRTWRNARHTASSRNNQNRSLAYLPVRR